MTAVLDAPAMSYNNESLDCATSGTPNLGERTLSVRDLMFFLNIAKY